MYYMIVNRETGKGWGNTPKLYTKKATAKGVLTGCITRNEFEWAVVEVDLSNGIVIPEHKMTQQEFDGRIKQEEIDLDNHIRHGGSDFDWFYTRGVDLIKRMRGRYNELKFV